MTIDYKDIPLQILPRFKGGEGENRARLRTDEYGKIMHGTLPPGSSIGLHTHEGSYEVIYILAGSGVCLDDGAEIPVRPGTVNLCLPGHSHSIINTGEEDLVLFAVIPNV
ncbi:MAG: cupin domain-containing protein [Oscillospiraceae bacterium]|nr:cupin domain-containing protein [Oscillospiraceae bacterium]